MRLFGRQKREAVGEATRQEGNASGSYSSNHVQAGTQTTSLKVSAWHRGVELRAQTMALLVAEYQVRTTRGNYATDETPIGRRMNYMLQVMPNGLMNWPTLIKQAEIQRVMQGNACIYLERDNGGEIKAMWLTNSASLNVIDNTYTIGYTGIGGPKSMTNVPASDVMHLKNSFSLDGGISGVSTLRWASRELGIAATDAELTLENAEKGGRIKLLVQEEKQGGMGLGRASRKAMEEIVQRANSQIYEQDVVLMSNVANVTPISFSMADQQLLESRKFSVRDVARYLGVPPVMLMDDSNSSYKSPEMATQEFLNRTISPIAREWETEFDAKVLGEAGWGVHRLHMCERNLLRMDPKGQAEIDKLKLETGVMSPNELRAQYDRGPVKDGDTHYVSTNLAVIGSAKLSGEEKGLTQGNE